MYFKCFIFGIHGIKKHSDRLLSKGQGWILLIVFIYFINRGTYDIYVKCDGVGRCVGTYDNRGCFGELALMYNTPRAATIIATSPGSIWGLVSRVLLLSYFKYIYIYIILISLEYYISTKKPPL